MWDMRELRMSVPITRFEWAKVELLCFREWPWPGIWRDNVRDLNGVEMGRVEFTSGI